MVIRNVLKDGAVLLLCLLFLIPFWMVIVNSLKTERDANLFGVSLPPDLSFHLENYRTVFVEGGILRGFLNGVLEGMVSTIVLVLITSISGFMLSRKKGRLSSASYYFFLLGLIIPPALVPTFLVLKATALLDSYAGIILIFIAYGIPFNIFLYTGFAKGIPKELDEAAFVEGCGSLRMFYTIIFPLLAPITVTCAIFNFVGAWNDVTIPMFFVNGDKWALPLTVYNFYSSYSKSWNLIFADIIITILPLLIVYLFAQRFMVEGMTAGAVKS